MEYFFRCNGNFIIHMKKLLHEIDFIWKNYYIIQFPWNKYYAGTNISSHIHRNTTRDVTTTLLVV
jgi:hypothetical protein